MLTAWRLLSETQQHYAKSAWEKKRKGKEKGDREKITVLLCSCAELMHSRLVSVESKKKELHQGFARISCCLPLWLTSVKINVFRDVLSALQVIDKMMQLRRFKCYSGNNCNPKHVTFIPSLFCPSFKGLNRRYLFPLHFSYCIGWR